MLSEDARQELERQQYRVIGEHSAVKVCGWTKNMIKGVGGCYKLTFYGIMSNQCMQMTTSISCANRCTFCWRGYKAPVSKEWKWGVDDPTMVMEESIKAHIKLIQGFGGNKDANPGAYKKAQKVEHVALSLTGEPIIYPRINEFIEECHKRGISTFLVTNAQYPDQIRDLKPITQLYISIDAPNKTLMKKVDVPLFSDFYERFLQSLDHMKNKKERTCVRLTGIKGVNMVEPENYATLIQRADPDFIEIKAYVCVGASRDRLTLKNMPLHEEIVEWSKVIAEHLPEYEIVTEHIPSRVVMLAKKKFKIDGVWHTWIDYPKFHELALSGKEFGQMEYIAKTPKVGISGKKTADYISPHKRKLKKRNLAFPNA